MEIERRDWVRALAAYPGEELRELAQALTAGWNVRPLSLPQAGLGMLKLRDGAGHQPFYLGEFPLARAAVAVIPDDGREYAGAAQVMGDSADLAESLAILDAVLANRLPGWREVARRVEAGMVRLREVARVRNAMLARTRVEFASLSQAEDADGD